MGAHLREALDKELLGWPGVAKEIGGNGPGRNGFWVPPATVYRFGRTHLGHVHHDRGGLTDFGFPSKVRERLVRTGRAIPHPAFPDSRTDASHELRDEEDLREVVDLFRLNYERAKKTAELRAERRTDRPEGTSA